MNKVYIYTSDNQKNAIFDFETEKSKEEITRELFRSKIYACQFANKFIAINTEKILFVVIEEVKNEL